MATMDSSARFFSKLRSLAVRLESERSTLEQTASQQISEEDDDTESGAVRALHELHSEVRELKRQVKGQVASKEDGSGELRSFIKACMVLKQRTTEDIERIKRHYEKYGYKPPKGFQKNPDVNAQGEDENRSLMEKSPKEEPAEEALGDGRKKEVQESVQEPETPERVPPPSGNQMRTPQLADFGLSAFHLQMVLGNAEQSHEAPFLPVISLSPKSPPPFVITTQPSQPKTPKCSLEMDEDAPTPRLEDFGITEHTMCLNNDFTMDLFRKKPPKGRQTNSITEDTAQRPSQNPSTPPSCTLHDKLSNVSMESPELPVFLTLDMKMNKQLVPSPAMPGGPESPPLRSNAAATPELPMFETPFVSKLISARKEARQHEKDGLTGSLNNIPSTLESPAVRAPSADIPQMPASLCWTKETTPEMPKLQSFFGRSLSGLVSSNQSGITEPPPFVLHTNDDHTEDWCLATPRVRMELQMEPHTPEMPDMSSVTQDILKLVSQGNSKPAPTASVQPSSKASLQKLSSGKENRVFDHVSEREFNGLDSYLKHPPHQFQPGNQ